MRRDVGRVGVWTTSDIAVPSDSDAIHTAKSSLIPFILFLINIILSYLKKRASGNDYKSIVFLLEAMNIGLCRYDTGCARRLLDMVCCGVVGWSACVALRRDTQFFNAHCVCLKNWWCDQGESNPQGLPHSILSAARLPVPPWSHGAVYIFIKLSFVFQQFL